MYVNLEVATWQCEAQAHNLSWPGGAISIFISL